MGLIASRTACARGGQLATDPRCPAITTTAFVHPVPAFLSGWLAHDVRVRDSQPQPTRRCQSRTLAAGHGRHARALRLACAVALRHSVPHVITSRPSAPGSTPPRPNSGILNPIAPEAEPMPTPRTGPRVKAGIVRFFGVKLCGLIVVEDAVAPRLRNGHVQVQALEDIANRPIIEHVLDALELAGVYEVIVASSLAISRDIRDDLATRAKGASVPIRFVQQPAPLELTDALTLAAPLVGDASCIVHLATGLLDEPLAPLVNRLTGAPDVVLIVHQAGSPMEHLSAATLEMLHLAEFNSDHALGMAGVWLFGPGALPFAGASRLCLGSDVDLTALGERISVEGGAFHVKVADTWRQYRGNPLDLLELNRIALDRLETTLRRPYNNGNRIEGRVWIHEAASVRASVILGPTVIGPGARIADAYIGPYTSIGERARVEGAEVEQSIISPGASVMHVGGRLVASVVGKDARVFRDFSLPRALRLRVGDGTEVALC